ncbi:MAG TPA: SDR family NAD(P)-dependent oxidoreductase [Vicinamibacterales bacterium]|nr:SDR family NAD(P)-dependent oxidoreductase [Vicinamibacterales bacterium]
MNLTNRAALITGARRIGAAVAVALAGRGCDVAVTYNRSRDEAESTADAVRSAGRRAAAVEADLTDAAACARAIERTVAALGRLDILVHMASLYTEVAFDALTPERFDRNISVDLRSGFLCARAAVPHMRAQGGGRIVLFSDWIAASGRPRYPGYLPYYVAKRGVMALAEGLALELAADNILVNAIAPGPILAPDETTDEERKAVEDATPLKRWGGPEEIVKIVLALIESDFVTGETVRVDGGRHVR